MSESRTPVFKAAALHDSTGLVAAASWLRSEGARAGEAALGERYNAAAELIESLVEPTGLLLTFCGPSSVGKDVVASEVRANLRADGLPLTFLEKYTTRKRRGTDESDGRILEPSSTYTYFESDEEFRASKDLFFPYTLYGHRYAFSMRHLVQRDREARVLSCILGPLERITEFSGAVRRLSGRLTISVLLLAPEEQLTRRLHRRHTLGRRERDARVGVLLDQAQYIGSNQDLLRDQFDLVVENGNSVPIASTVDAIVSLAKAHVQDLY